MRFVVRPLLRAASATLLVSAVPSMASAQMPDTFENLEVLPADTSKEQMTAIMRGFSGALGVRCTFCHAGEPQKIDFKSDEKDEKKSARLMMKMVAAINNDTIAQLGTMSEGSEVTCYTCHRGAERPPRRLSDVLVETTSSKGAAAAIDQYKKLRDEKLEAGQYDFRVQMLTAAAGRLREEKKLEESLGLLKAATTLFPKSGEAAAMHGMALADRGDRAAAEAELTRALELDPDNRMAKGALDRLKTGGQAPAPR